MWQASFLEMTKMLHLIRIPKTTVKPIVGKNQAIFFQTSNRLHRTAFRFLVKCWQLPNQPIDGTGKAIISQLQKVSLEDVNPIKNLPGHQRIKGGWFFKQQVLRQLSINCIMYTYWNFVIHNSLEFMCPRINTSSPR